MRFTVAPDEALWTDNNRAVVVRRSGPLRQTGDDHHLSALRELEQPFASSVRREPVRTRSRTSSFETNWYPGAELRQDQKVGFGRLERGDNAIQIVGHLSELRIVLIVPDPHRHR